MNLSRSIAYLSVCILILALLTCTSLSRESGKTGEPDAGTNGKSSLNHDEGDDPIVGIQNPEEFGNPNKPAQKARKWLAEYLDVPLGRVKVVSVQEMYWPDACLGLPGPEESCAQVITPGYLVILRALDEKYELHTDIAANNIRMAQ